MALSHDFLNNDKLYKWKGFDCRAPGSILAIVKAQSTSGKILLLMPGPYL